MCIQNSLLLGMFSQVIVQSGSPLAFWAVHNETSDLTLYVRSLATELSCNRQDMVDIVSCLRDVDWQKFVWLDAAVCVNLHFLIRTTGWLNKNVSADKT